eukprot:6472306-Prymnesium_polylepis.1
MAGNSLRRRRCTARNRSTSCDCLCTRRTLHLPLRVGICQRDTLHIGSALRWVDGSLHSETGVSTQSGATEVEVCCAGFFGFAPGTQLMASAAPATA